MAPGVTLNPVAGAVAEYAAIAAANPVAVPLGQTLSEARLRQMENLWGARDMAVMTQFSVGIDEREALFAMGLVNQIELALIMMFGQSVPDRTRRWDELRTQKEIYIRLVRRNRIERELKRERSGLRGIMNTVRGRRPLSPREVYARLTEYVDDMVSIMEIGNPGEDTVRTVRDFMEGGPMAPGGNR